MAVDVASVVVVGSVNVDLIVRSERLPRPGETVVGGDLLTAGGGKGANQAMAAHRLGADVRFIARIGHDGPGDFVQTSFESERLSSRWLTVDPVAATGVALILVDRRGENVISVAPGANARLRPDDVRAAEDAFDGARVLLVQLEIPIETVRTALEIARTRGIITVLNPAPARPVPDDLLRLVEWLTPNETEAAMLGAPSGDRSEARRGAHALRARGPSGVVVTLGERGAVAEAAEGTIDLEPFSVAAIDTTAAGDAFSAGLAVGLARGMAAPEALRYASAAGALTTTRQGAQPSLPRDDEVRKLLESRRFGDRIRG
ncbi:MAG: ribokinase [Chloroflexota bacterium]